MPSSIVVGWVFGAWRAWSALNAKMGTTGRIVEGAIMWVVPYRFEKRGGRPNEYRWRRIIPINALVAGHGGGGPARGAFLIL